MLREDATARSGGQLAGGRRVRLLPLVGEPTEGETRGVQRLTERRSLSIPSKGSYRQLRHCALSKTDEQELIALQSVKRDFFCPPCFQIFFWFLVFGIFQPYSLCFTNPRLGWISVSTLLELHGVGRSVNPLLMRLRRMSHAMRLRRMLHAARRDCR